MCGSKERLRNLETGVREQRFVLRDHLSVFLAAVYELVKTSK